MLEIAVLVPLLEFARAIACKHEMSVAVDEAGRNLYPMGRSVTNMSPVGRKARLQG